MPRSRNNAPRCGACRLHRSVCICDLIPTLPTRTRVLLLLHQLEAHKPTNTGRLALRCLPNSELAWRGRLDIAMDPLPGSSAPPETDLQPADAEHAQAHDRAHPHPHAHDHAHASAPHQPPPWLTRAVNPVLLFPHPEATPLTTWRQSPDPITLIVPDGTWSQAVRARKRVPGLADIPCAALPPGLVSTYRLRHEPRPGRVSTLEAIAHALEILESPSVATALLHIHRVAVERTLWTKGLLPRAEVWGGIPPGAQPQDPESGLPRSE